MAPAVPLRAADKGPARARAGAEGGVGPIGSAVTQKALGPVTLGARGDPTLRGGTRGGSEKDHPHLSHHNDKTPQRRIHQVSVVTWVYTDVHDFVYLL